MTVWYLLLRGIGIGLLAGMILTIALRFRQAYPLRLLALFGACLCGYLLAPVLHELGRGPAFYLAVAFSDAAVLAFLLLVQALFEDHRRPDTRTLGFGAAYLGASYIEIGLAHGLGLDTRWLEVPVRLAMLAGALYALYVVVRNWQQDLVEARRRLRLAVIAVTGCYVLGVTLAESLVGGGTFPPWVELANSVGIVASILVFACAALVLGADGLLPAVAALDPAAPPPPEPHQDPELRRILSAMEEDAAYRDMELTIRGLAERVGSAEHRVRRLINRELQFRNFNDFLNHYRLREVARRLAEPAESRVPILTIAMDAGYRSMTTFNRAFRAAYGLTPTQFRRNPCAIPEKS